MPNPSGSFVLLQDAAGIVTDTSSHQVTGLVLKSALTGTLTVVGVNNLDGSAATWVIAPASTGWQSPPGNAAGLANKLSYTLSNVGADAGKTLLMFTAR